MTGRTTWWACFGALLLFGAAAAVSCSTSGDGGDVTGESHWLTPCRAGDPCEDGTCICGRCTTACGQEGPCEGPNVMCTTSSTCGVERCAAGCDADKDCGSGESCDGGACAPMAAWVCDGAQAVRDIRGGAQVVSGPPAAGGNCADVHSGSSPAYCSLEGSTAEVAIRDGASFASVCYPTSADTIVEAAEWTGDLSVEATGVMVLFPDAETAIDGDVVVVGERSVVVGADAERSSIAGALTLDGNLSRVRDLAVDGSLTITERANNAGLSRVRVRGDLVIFGNGATVIATEAHGALRVEGEGVVLVGVGVAGAFEPAADVVCEGCYQFDDVDGDGAVADDEVVGALEIEPGG